MISGYLELYPNDVHLMLQCCEKHNMCLTQVRQFAELMAPICDKLSPSGAVAWLERMTRLILRDEED